MQTQQLLDFLKKLKKNNTKEWFDKNKKEYDTLRAEWVLFVEDAIKQIAKFDPEYATVEAKKCIFRINRDVRFSKDKSPYKTNFGASINKGGKNSPTGGYYLHFEPGNCFIAGGMYMPDAEILGKVRQEIDYNLKEFTKIVEHKEFKKYFGTLGGEKLSRPPKGFDIDNPALEFLKHKSFLAFHKVDDKTALGKDYNKYVTSVFKAMKPMCDFLNRSLD